VARAKLWRIIEAGPPRPVGRARPPGTLFNLGIVRWQGKSDPKGAVQAWEELLQKNPNYPQKQQLQEYIGKAKQHAKG
jgi:hypothetical protein